MPVRLNSSGGGSVTLDVPSTASTFTLNLPAQSGSVVAADASGNVGIGTTAPNKSGSNVALTVNAASGQYPAIELSTGNVGRWYINADATNVYDTAMNNTNRTFYTGGFERARITSGGNLFVGTSSSFGNAGRVEIDAGASGNGLNVRCASSAFSLVCFNNGGSGLVYFTTTGSGSVGTITTNGSTTSYNSSSDYRLKANVVPLTGAAARVQALKPSRFNFIVDPDRTVDGFIAHEAAEVVPEAVTGEKDAVNEDGSIKPQGIDQSKLVPLLTAALQEALSRIETLEARLAAVEAR